MNKERKKAQLELEEMVKSQGGKVIIAMVHPIYGALRGLNFALENTDKKRINEILDFIELAQTPLDREKALLMMEAAENGTLKVAGIQELVLDVWLKTSLATMPLAIGHTTDDHFENPPEVAKSLEDGVRIISRSLKMTAPLQAKDPFFFRVGIL